jgi:hypothetical protein
MRSVCPECKNLTKVFKKETEKDREKKGKGRGVGRNYRPILLMNIDARNHLTKY